MMHKTNLRPTVTISTYSASAPSRKQLGSSQRQAESSAEPSATRSEFSTELFSKFRARGFASAAYRGLLLELSQIKGPSGSIRGHKDVVRKSLESIKVAHSRRLASSAACLSSFGARAPNSQLEHSIVRSSNYMLLSSADAQHQDRSAWAENRLHSSLGSSQAANEQHYLTEYLERLQDEELNKCVAYTTSLGVIRRTFEDSKVLRSILNLNLIKYEERDIFLNQEYKRQLRCRISSFMVPAIFVDGQLLGGLNELESINESGELLKRLSKFKMSAPSQAVCACCGNARFIACQSCHGSRKSTIHHFKFNSIALRCIKCDKNEGLVQCPACSAAEQEAPLSLGGGGKQQPDANNNNQTSDDEEHRAATAAATEGVPTSER